MTEQAQQKEDLINELFSDKILINNILKEKNTEVLEQDGFMVEKVSYKKRTDYHISFPTRVKEDVYKKINVFFSYSKEIHVREITEISTKKTTVIFVTILDEDYSGLKELLKAISN